MDNTEVINEDRAKSVKMNICSALDAESEQYECTTMEKLEQTLPSGQYSAADPLETSVKVEPEEDTEMIADVYALPAKVELVEVPDSEVGSYINSFIKMVPTEIQEPSLSLPFQSTSKGQCIQKTDTNSSKKLKLQCQTILEYTEREKFDKFDIFSEFVATKLRYLRSADRKVNIMNSIIELFENYYE